MFRFLLLALVLAFASAFSPVAIRSPLAAAAVDARSAESSIVMAAKKKGVNPALFATGIKAKAKTQGRKMSSFGGRTQFEKQKFGKDGAYTLAKPWEQVPFFFSARAPRPSILLPCSPALGARAGP